MFNTRFIYFAGEKAPQKSEAPKEKSFSELWESLNDMKEVEKDKAATVIKEMSDVVLKNAKSITPKNYDALLKVANKDLYDEQARNQLKLAIVASDAEKGPLAESLSKNKDYVANLLNQCDLKSDALEPFLQRLANSKSLMIRKTIAYNRSTPFEILDVIIKNAGNSDEEKKLKNGAQYNKDERKNG